MQINSLNVSFKDIEVFNNFNLSLVDNEITCILGPSGCGKTTLLNAISNKNNAVDNDKKLAYVYQESRLINSITVLNNLKFIMDVFDECKVDRILNELKILDCKYKYPNELSGGQASRVAIARAYLFDAKIILMDEPFKDLDLSLKFELLKSLKKMQIENNLGIIYVTHNVDEALLIANRIIVLDEKPCLIKNDIRIMDNEIDRNLSNIELNKAREMIYSTLLDKKS